jgi:deazaflavin-dependent oxidoreductase (nitroreductase family)
VERLFDASDQRRVSTIERSEILSESEAVSNAQIGVRLSHRTSSMPLLERLRYPREEGNSLAASECSSKSGSGTGAHPADLMTSGASGVSRDTAAMVLKRVRPWLVRALRAPAVLYDWHLGWLLGKRFLRLTHRGRRSGRCYRTMLEVIGNDPVSGELFVMVGLGRKAQWYRNVLAGGAVEVAAGSRRFHPMFRELAPPEAAAVVGEYERRNRLVTPIVRAMLSALVGWRYDGSPSARERLVKDRPILAFRPAS